MLYKFFYLLDQVFDITNEIVYGEFQHNGSIDTITNTKILSKVICNHLNDEELKRIQRNPISLKENSVDEIRGDNDEFASISEIPNEQPEDLDNEVDDIPTLNIDSGNVSPESIPISSYREDSRLSNVTPIAVYTPDTFRREHQIKEQTGLEQFMRYINILFIVYIYFASRFPDKNTSKASLVLAHLNLHYKS